jgi:acyl carrier protein
MENIKNKIISILKKYTFDKKIWENIPENPDITKDLKINSARIVDIILDIEEEFKIEIDDKSLEGIKTINDAESVISKKLEEKK